MRSCFAAVLLLVMVLPTTIRADDRRHNDRPAVTIRDLGTFSAGGHAAAFAINDRGEMAGTVSVGTQVRAAMWDRRGHAQVIANEESQGFDINNSGVVMGTFEGRGGTSVLSRTGF